MDIQAPIYNPNASKKLTIVSINSDLLLQAKALHINLSSTLEERLAEVVREARQRQWLEENSAAIDDYNCRVDKKGLFSDGLKRF